MAKDLRKGRKAQPSMTAENDKAQVAPSQMEALSGQEPLRIPLQSDPDYYFSPEYIYDDDELKEPEAGLVLRHVSDPKRPLYVLGIGEDGKLKNYDDRKSLDKPVPLEKTPFSSQERIAALEKKGIADFVSSFDPESEENKAMLENAEEMFFDSPQFDEVTDSVLLTQYMQAMGLYYGKYYDMIYDAMNDAKDIKAKEDAYKSVQKPEILDKTEPDGVGAAMKQSLERANVLDIESKIEDHKLKLVEKGEDERARNISFEQGHTGMLWNLQDMRRMYDDSMSHERVAERLMKKGQAIRDGYDAEIADVNLIKNLGEAMEKYETKKGKFRSHADEMKAVENLALARKSMTPSAMTKMLAMRDETEKPDYEKMQDYALQLKSNAMKNYETRMVDHYYDICSMHYGKDSEFHADAPEFAAYIKQEHPFHMHASFGNYSKEFENCGGDRSVLNKVFPTSGIKEPEKKVSRELPNGETYEPGKGPASREMPDIRSMMEEENDGYSL